MGVSCKVVRAPRGRKCTPPEEESHIYWAEEGALFNLGVFHRVSRMTTKKVDSISGNNKVLPAKILATPISVTYTSLS